MSFIFDPRVPEILNNFAGGEVFAADMDFWLSPCCRILADDGPGHFTIDGCGHTLNLPKSSQIRQSIPLILIGNDCTLTLKNVRIRNFASISTCLKLGPGAKLDLSKGVVRDIEDTSSEPLSPSSLAPTSKTGHAPGSIVTTKLKISVAAYGLGLHMVKSSDLSYYKSSKSNSSSSLDSERHASGKPSSEVHLIGILLDLNAKYQSEGERQDVHADIKGLRASSHYIEDLERELEIRSAQSLSTRRKLIGRKESDILLPVDANITFSNAKDAVDTKVEVSEFKVLLSPGILEMSTFLLKDALAPLLQPGADFPVRAVSNYQKVGTLRRETISSGQNISEYEVSLLYEQEYLTFWRPQCATGYLSAGDIITSGIKAPSFEVLTLAKNSGLIDYPESFRRIAALESVYIWQPIPKAGYIAAGCITTTENSPPHLHSVVCLAQQITVPAPVSNVAAFHDANMVARYQIWSLDNSMGTFAVSAPLEQFDFVGVDLRNPVGVTPAGLLSKGYGKGGSYEKNPSEFLRTIRKEYLKFQSQDTVSISRRLNAPHTVDFKRIWTDGGAFSAGKGVSIWRPIAPAGYAFLGDCFCNGFTPPKSVHVLNASRMSNTLSDQALLADPIDYQMVWHDGNPRSDLRTTIWKPVAPEGYVSLGSVVSIGRLPSRIDVKCIRIDVTLPASVPRKPLWFIRKDQNLTPPLSVWTVEDAVGSFHVNPSDHISPPRDLCHLNLDALEKMPSQDQGKTINTVVKIKSLDMHLYDTFNAPTMQLTVKNIESGVRGYSTHLIQAYVGFKPSVSAYNKIVMAWEPVLEPFDAIIKMDCNFSKKVRKLCIIYFAT